MHNYTAILYHITFATFDRKPTIASSFRDRFHTYLGGIANNLRAKALEIGGVADHVHLMIEAGPTLSVADLVGKLKSNSSRWLHDTSLAHRRHSESLIRNWSGIREELLKGTYRPKLCGVPSSVGLNLCPLHRLVWFVQQAVTGQRQANASIDPTLSAVRSAWYISDVLSKFLLPKYFDDTLHLTRLSTR
ncbi:MAG TPA: IS200/IS605 family transposase [Thermoanaerobaculia bacterium]|nr:IS200/IS605 family transposase [Thermoanaerobaculia bacterium]